MDRYSRLFLFATPIVVVFFSLWQGAYDIDPHHWGLMLSNAKDLYEGQVPYKEIFIQYGILTTILQAAAFGIGKNMLAIIVVTSACYAGGILILYAIALNVLQNKTNALYVLILLVLFHPLAMYPWSNYIAFPFFMGGIYFLVRKDSGGGLMKIPTFLAGIFLGLASLAREGLAPAAILFILLSFIFDFIKSTQKKKTFYQFIFCAIGFAIPLSVFTSYLVYAGLIEYWIKLSVELPRIYLNESFKYIKSFIFKAFFQEIYTGYRHGDPRWILTSFFTLTSFWIFILALFGKVAAKPKRFYVDSSLVKVALACLLLISASLHLAETFRIATGSSLGLIVLFSFLRSKGWEKTFLLSLPYG